MVHLQNDQPRGHNIGDHRARFGYKERLPFTKEIWKSRLLRPFWFARPENSQNKRNLLRRSPKFQPEIVFHLFFLPAPGPVPIVKLESDSL